MSPSQQSHSNVTSSIIAVIAASCGWILREKYEQQKRSRNSKYEIPNDLQSGDHIEEMKLAVKLAIQAGGNMIEYLEQKGTDAENGESTLGISSKSNDADFCTAIDIQNEDLVTKALSSTFPTHQIIGEESTGTDKPAPLTNEPTWIIDPIDGTTNFAAGCPLTCVSIGYCIKGEPVMGVVFSPKTEELYLAMNGKGAYRNGERISVNSCQSKTLSNSVVCFEFGSSRAKEGVDKMMGAAKRLLMHGCRSTRSYGSGVLDLCYVASTRLDVVYTGMYEEGWKPWDYCAGMVIAEEAGCIIRSLKGDGKVKEFDDERKVILDSKFDIYSDSMICGVNTTVVEQCRNVVLGIHHNQA